MNYQKCEYMDCMKNSIYELYWESADDKGNFVEGDTNNLMCSCSSHLVDIVKHHEFGPPVDYVRLSKTIRHLVKLCNWINYQATK